MPKGKPYSYKTGRDHPSVGRAPTGGGAGRGPFGRDTVKASVPRGSKPPRMGRDHPASQDALDVKKVGNQFGE